MPRPPDRRTLASHAQVSNQNDKAWLVHVELLNVRFNVLFDVLLAISIGCILGLQDLIGLPNPAMPSIGVPDVQPA